MSSRRPTNGLTMEAPAFAAKSACGTLKQRVTFTRMSCSRSFRTARSPSAVSGHLTTILGAIAASSRPSATMPAASVATTSADTSPETNSQMRARISRGSPLSRAISDGFVVTPSTSPISAAREISATLAVSRKICKRGGLRVPGAPRRDRRDGIVVPPAGSGAAAG